MNNIKTVLEAIEKAVLKEEFSKEDNVRLHVLLSSVVSAVNSWSESYDSARFKEEQLPVLMDKLSRILKIINE